MKKIISKILVIFIILLTLVEFILTTNVSNAAMKIDASMLNLITNLAGGLVSIIYWPQRLQATGIAAVADFLIAQIAGSEGHSGTNFLITPYDIFFNKYTLLDVNFFDIPTNTTTLTYSIRVSVAKWFYVMRILAAAILLVILIYVGIRMAISTIGEEKAKYKKMLYDWCCSLALIFILQYIAIFTVYCNNAIVNVLAGLLKNTNGVETKLSGMFIEIGIVGAAGIGFNSIAAVLVFVVIVFQTLSFLIAYISRMVKIGFLIIISPLISLTYSLDKMGDGKAQALGAWFKEYVYTILIQPFHCIMYLAFIRTAFALMVDPTKTTNALQATGMTIKELVSPEYNQLVSGVLAIVCLLFVSNAEKVVRKIFGFQDDNSKTSMAAGLAVGVAAIKNAKKIGSTTRKGFNMVSKGLGGAGSKLGIALKNDAGVLGGLKNRIHDRMEASGVGSKVLGVASAIGKANKAMVKVGKKVISAPKTLKNKFTRSKVGRSIKSFSNKHPRLASVGRNIKARNSLSNTLGTMAAVAAMSGGANPLEAMGIKDAVTNGTSEFMSGSEANLAEEAEKDIESADMEADVNEAVAVADEAEQKMNNESFAESYDQKSGNYNAAKKAYDREIETTSGLQAELDGLKEEKDFSYDADKKKRAEELQAEIDRRQAEGGEEAVAAAAFREQEEEMEKFFQDQEAENIQHLFKNSSGEYVRRETAAKNLENETKERIKQKLIDRQSDGSSVEALRNRKNRIVQALTALKLQDKQKDGNENHELTTEEIDSVQSTADMLMQQISLDVRRHQGFDEAKSLSGIQSSLGLSDDLSTFGGYQEIRSAISDYDTGQRNAKFAETIGHHQSLNGDTNHMLDRIASNQFDRAMQERRSARK